MFPREAGRGPRGEATPLQRRRGPEAQSLPWRKGESLGVAQTEGRGNGACVPRQPSLWEQGGGGGPRWGRHPGSRAEAVEINSGYWRGVTDRRGAGEGAGGGSGEGWGRRSVSVLGGRPEVWGRHSSSSAGSDQRLQAALSPPPGAFSPVRSRARAARGEGRRRREQPVV